MKKVFYVLSICIIGALGLSSCGKDKDEAKEDDGKVYLVKSITCTDNDSKYTFTYDNNNRLVKVLKEEDDLIEEGKYSYQGNTITETWTVSNEIVPQRLSRVITMDASNEFISNLIETHTNYYDDGETREYNYPVSFSFNLGYITKEIEEGGEETYTWTNGNVTLDNFETTYSNIKNKTNMDFVLFYVMLYGRDNLCFYRIFSQFIKNVSKNIPASQSFDPGGEDDIVKYDFSTTLDEKGRPSKITVDEDESFIFEYYD